MYVCSVRFVPDLICRCQNTECTVRDRAAGSSSSTRAQHRHPTYYILSLRARSSEIGRRLWRRRFFFATEETYSTAIWLQRWVGGLAATAGFVLCRFLYRLRCTSFARRSRSNCTQPLRCTGALGVYYFLRLFNHSPPPVSVCLNGLTRYLRALTGLDEK